MLYAHVFSGNHLTVEEQILRTILLVVMLYDAEHTLYEMLVVLVRGNLQPHELGSLNQSVDADGQILAADIDISGIEQRQHAVVLQFLQVFIVSHLHLVTEVYDRSQILLVVDIVVDGILDAAVQVDGQHTL